MSRKRPSLRTCLGLGSGLQEGTRIRKRPSVKNSARKDKKSSNNRGEDGSISKGHTPEKTTLPRRREEKASRKNMIWVNIQTNPESVALKTIAVTSAMQDGEEAANEDQDLQ